MGGVSYLSNRLDMGAHDLPGLLVRVFPYQLSDQFGWCSMKECHYKQTGINIQNKASDVSKCTILLVLSPHDIWVDNSCHVVT